MVETLALWVHRVYGFCDVCDRLPELRAQFSVQLEPGRAPWHVSPGEKLDVVLGTAPRIHLDSNAAFISGRAVGKGAASRFGR